MLLPDARTVSPATFSRPEMLTLPARLTVAVPLSWALPAVVRSPRVWWWGGGVLFPFPVWLTFSGGGPGFLNRFACVLVFKFAVLGRGARCVFNRPGIRVNPPPGGVGFRPPAVIHTKGK